jgi:hypothetical protein
MPIFDRRRAGPLARCVPPQLFMAFLAMLWAVPAVAQAPRGPAAASPAQIPAKNHVVLTRADCVRLTAHQPAPDVTYQPGVDVHGHPVAPADLPGTPQVAMPEEITIAITVELEKRFGIPITSNLFKPDATIGTVTVRPDGTAFFNGQPLTDREQAALAYLCQQQGPLGR